MPLSSRLACVCGAQPLRQRLQELPSNGSISFDQRTELPEGEPIAYEIGRSGHRGRSRPAVDQGDFAEVITRTESSEVDAFARDRGLSGIDKKEGSAPR